ncbi:MAG: DUF1049 domain-containing protein [Steroidobacteraceae bacterium]|nr:DUF1049 domain-containing protein [Steroidobacteraceae bacterium]
MRFVYMALIVLFTGLVILFKVQNLEAVTITLFSASVTLPVSVLVLLIYVLGMLTGGFLLMLLRTWVHGATRRS